MIENYKEGIVEKIKNTWEEAKLLTDGMHSVRKTIKIFLSILAFDLVISPLLFWWFETRVEKKRQKKWRG